MYFGLQFQEILILISPSPLSSLLQRYINQTILLIIQYYLNKQKYFLIIPMASGYTTSGSVTKQLLQAIQDQSFVKTKQFLHKLVRQLKQHNDQNLTLLKDTIGGIANILKDPNVHPKIKFESHKIIMYLILLADLDVYEQFLQNLYPILKGNCMYNKALPLGQRGQDFFKQSKYFTDPTATNLQKNQIKKYGASYIIFCLQTVYQLARWLPYDLQDDTKPTKFVLSFDQLIKLGVQFPSQDDFQFYNNYNVQQIQKVIRDIQKQYQSLLGPNSQARPTSVGQLKIVSVDGFYNSEAKKKRGSLQRKNSNLPNNQSRISSRLQSKIDMQIKNKIFLLQDQKTKLLKQIQIQRNYFEGQIQKQKRIHQQNVFKYQKKITGLQEQAQKLKQKIIILENRNMTVNQQSKSNQYSDRNKDRIIEEIQSNNRILQTKIMKLQEQIKILEHERKVSANMQGSGVNNNHGQSGLSLEIQKLKKQNKSLKAKLLTQCSEYSQFSTKRRNNKTQNSDKQPQSLKFYGYQQARNCYEPFYSNSSSEVKIRLRKAILREKQLLYRDKIVQIGCISKLQDANSIKVTIVFTNISEKPLFNFSLDFVSREDLVVKLTQNTKNYLQISGQTKCQLLVTINQIDFRCLLCALRFNIEEQTQKIALILPVSKLKLAQQLVYTPIKKQQKIKKIQKVFQYDRKIMPNLHKFKDYFDKAILQTDRTMHESYNLKMQFMGSKMYIQCDQIQGQLRIAVKYLQQQEYSKVQKFLQELVFLFSKN